VTSADIGRSAARPATLGYLLYEPYKRGAARARPCASRGVSSRRGADRDQAAGSRMHAVAEGRPARGIYAWLRKNAAGGTREGRGRRRLKRPKAFISACAGPACGHGPTPGANPCNTRACRSNFLTSLVPITNAFVHSVDSHIPAAQLIVARQASQTNFFFSRKVRVRSTERSCPLFSTRKADHRDPIRYVPWHAHRQHRNHANLNKTRTRLGKIHRSFCPSFP
jgi:hypothetical protein